MTTKRDPMDAVRAELLHHRKRVPLSYPQAGKRAGITGQWWRNLERGYEVKGDVRLPVNITRDRLITMARAVGWSPDEALALAEMAPLTDAERLSHGPRQELARLLPTLSESQVQALLYTARTMLDPNAGSIVYTEREVAGPRRPDPREEGNELTNS